MSVRFSVLAILFSLIAWAQPVLAEVTVTAEIDREVLDPEDVLTYSIIVSATEEYDMTDPRIPDFRDFQVVKEWPSASSQSNIVITPNGPEYQFRVTRSFNYVLQPKREGQLTIGPASIDVGGRRYNTRSVTVQVKKGAESLGGQPGGGNGRRAQRGQNPGGAQPQLPPGFQDMFSDEDSLFEQLLKRQQQMMQMPGGGGGGFRTQPINPNEAFFVQVEVDKQNVYQDEQVTASWYLYTRANIRDLDTLKYPSLRGFWKEDIEIATQLNWQQEVINGIPYRRALLATFALFPIKAGSSTIDEYKVRCTVSDVLDPFGGGEYRKYTKTSQPVKVTVKPLPTEGRPQDFSGAVGQFQVQAKVEDPNVVVGQPFALKLRFEGRGNAKRLDLPEVKLPEGLELYEVQNDSKFFRTGTSYRDFTLLIIPRKEGDIAIPPLTVSYFDPAQGKYVQLTTETLQVRAMKGTGASGSATNQRVGEKSQRELLKTQDPQIELDFAGHIPATRTQQTTGFVVALLCVFATLLWRAQVELGWGQRKRDLNRRLQARFRKIDERVSAGDWRGVGVEVTNTVYFVLGEVSGQGGANVELDKLMLQAPPSVRRELSEPVKRLMETFQAISFAPDEVAKNLREPASVKKYLSEMRGVLEKAVTLGLSAEPDGGSEIGPKAS
jgi:hypothetical protein